MLEERVLYEYDYLGRIIKHTEIVDNTAYVYRFAYDTYGRLYTETYPNNFTVEYVYDDNSLLIGVKNHSSGDYIWQTNDYNAAGQVLSIDLQNNLRIEYQYDNFHFPELIRLKKSVNLQLELEYEFEPETGNLKKRKDNIRNRSEIFEYDNLNRLTDYVVLAGATSAAAHSVDYDILGNIAEKSDIGTYEYDNDKRHAVAKVQPYEGVETISYDEQNILYNANNKAKEIYEDDKELKFTYGYDGQRRKTHLRQNGEEVYTRYFIGKYEKEVTSAGTKEICYINGPAGYIAMYITENSTSNLYYNFSDYLGSVLAVYNTDASILQEQSFDPWGRYRNPVTWEYENAQPISIIFRGYTGHEMLPEFDLINMNGRMYDPVLGRMLSPDNYVQDPMFPQNYNRYSYCANNPLIYTDPSGEWFLIDDAVVAGAGFLFGYLGHGITTGDWGWSAVASGGIGALTAWLGYNTAGLAYGCVDHATMKYIGSMAMNTVAGQIMPPMNIPVGNNFSISVSPGFGIGSSGNLIGGLNFTGTYTSGDWALSAGYGVSNAGNTVYGGATYYDRANDQYFSYYATHFSGQYKQTVGGFGYRKGDFSVRWENDFFANSGDKYRTNALEFGYGDFVLGTNLWTNDPEGEGSLIDPNGTNLRGKTSKSGAWENGQVWSAPLYVGYRQGNTISRIGFSNPLIQDRTQNFVHKNINPTPFFNKYDNFQGGTWSYSGYYNPYTLY
jgi:RHS repeat-associated protein